MQAPLQPALRRPSTDTWDAVSDLYPYRVFYAYAAADKKAYFAGGLANEEVFDIINILEYTPGISSDDSEIPVPDNTIEVNPNPAQSKFQLEYHLTMAQFVNISILNNVGEVMEVLHNGIQKQGVHRTLVHAEGMKPGVYFIVMKTNQSTTTKKIIKLD